MVKEKDILGLVVFIALILALGLALQGCSLKIETLYHGKTPVGIDDRKATAMTAAQPRVIKVRNDREED